MQSTLGGLCGLITQHQPTLVNKWTPEVFCNGNNIGAWLVVVAADYLPNNTTKVPIKGQLVRFSYYLNELRINDVWILIAKQQCKL